MHIKGLQSREQGEKHFEKNVQVYHVSSRDLDIDNANEIKH